MSDADQFAFPDELNQCGLTKREYFAAAAMQGLLQDSVNTDDQGYFEACVKRPTAVAAVAMADALLAELEKK